MDTDGIALGGDFGVMGPLGYIPTAPVTHWAAGIDLGKVTDPTTVVILRKTHSPIPVVSGNASTIGPDLIQRLDEGKVYVEWAGRIALKTGYLQQAQMLKVLHDTEPYKTCCKDWVCDATGVGAGVVDILTGVGLHTIRVTITAGRNQGRDPNGRISLPKIDMIGALMGSFASFQLQISPKLPDYVEFMKQMRSMQQSFSATGAAMTFNGASGTHDDYCTAAGLALWRLNPAKSGSRWSVQQLII